MARPVDFYFDYASPWAYLANAVLPRRLTGLDIVHRPVYLRGFEMFSEKVPFVANKLAYLGLDWDRCRLREGVEGSMPSTLPINGLHAVRGARFTLREGGFREYNERIFRATWCENANISDREVVLALAVEAGQDRARFAAGVADPELKDELRRETAEAEARGLFGLPSFCVDGELFWGYDRLDQVREAAEAG